MTQVFNWPNTTTTFPHALQIPLTGQQWKPPLHEDNHLIGTWTGDGSQDTNQQPNTNKKTSITIFEQIFNPRTCENTNTLLGLQCTTENTQKKRNTPAKYETTIDETLPTTSYRNLYPSGRAWDQQHYQKKPMYTDYIQPLRNINKLAGKYVYRTTEKHEGQTWNIHAIRTTTSKDEHITTDNSPRTVRCGDKKWAKVRSPGRRGLTFITWSPVIYEL